MATSYKTLSDGVLDKLKSSGLPNITEEELDEIIFTYIRPACVKFKACNKDLTKRDDLAGQFGEFEADLTDEEIEILVSFMLIEYLSANYINVPSLLRQNLTSKDFKVFSSAEHLLRLTDLRNTYIKEVRQMISIYTNYDSDLFSMLKK